MSQKFVEKKYHFFIPLKCENSLPKLKLNCQIMAGKYNWKMELEIIKIKPENMSN
jgi:hypothetical protein